MADVNNGKKATQNIERNSVLNTGQGSKNVVPHVKISQCNYMIHMNNILQSCKKHYGLSV